MPTRSFLLNENKLRLDARPDRLDLRDLTYQAPLGNLPPEYPIQASIAQLLPAYFGAGLILNQSSEGACTGFGLAAVINYLRWLDAFHKQTPFTPQNLVSPRMLYQLAKFYDEWEGEEYDGSSCRGALKGWHRHGVCLESKWPYNNGIFVRPNEGWDVDALTHPLGVYYRINKASVVDMQAAIYSVGAIYVSANVHEGWMLGQFDCPQPSHQALPVIIPNPVIMGGHAFAIVGYNTLGFVVQNSWGEDWGYKGFAVLTYEDWVQNGSDAWAVSMGVPVKSPQGHNVRQNLATRRDSSLASLALPGFGFGQDPLAGRTDIWSENQAYDHTLVTGNDGFIINRLPQLKDANDAAKYVAYEQPLKWFDNLPDGVPWKLAIYAHGGLNSEEDSIQRIRILGPNFIDNDVYPLFTTWRSGWIETLGDMLEDAWNKRFGAAGLPSQGLGDMLIEASDRVLEVACRYIAVRSMWSEMKENVEKSAGTKRGIDTLALQLAELGRKAVAANKRLEVHLVGHSAGSFVIGRLLSEFSGLKLGAGSCTLFAPACDLDFALNHYRAAIQSGRLSGQQFMIHTLSDQLELDDSVGPYRKSLLYLVSRALERVHKMPLLGMEKSYVGSLEDWDFSTHQAVNNWRNFFIPANGMALVQAAPQVNTGPRKIDSTHGAFDNSQFHIQDAIERIRGAGLKKPLTSLDY